MTPAAHATPLSFDGSFDNGLSAWNSSGGGAQCANYGTPSNNQRLRGNFYVDTAVVGEGTASGRFDLPPSQAGFPLEACELTHPVPLNLGTDQYYGYMFYVPTGWTTGTSAFWGVTTAQFHFQNIWGSPIEFQLQNDHLTMALETGPCSNFTTSLPGCQYRSNADDSSCVSDATHTCLPAMYAVPPGMQQGVWHEVVMHVHWASDSTGQIDIWHRVEGQTGWTQTVTLRGYPTVQWDVTQGCCAANATDKVGAYRGFSSVPVSVWEDNIIDGPDFATVAGSMPLAPGAAVSAGSPTPIIVGSPPPALPGPTPTIPTPRPVNTPKAHTGSVHPHRAKVLPRCISATVWRSWLKHHPHKSPRRLRMLARKRVVVRRGERITRRHSVTLYCR